MIREEILKLGAPVEPNNFETDREEQWYKVGLYEGATAIPWHKVASGDLPKEQKGDATILPFLVKAKDGDVYMAYYAWYEEEDTPTFYDDCDCPLDVEYWMEVPEPPK